MLQCALAGEGTGQDMEDDLQISSEPTWLDPRNDRKTPYTDAKLDVLANDFITGMADTMAWQDLVAEVGEPRTCAILKQRLAGQDPNSLINWRPGGPTSWHCPSSRRQCPA